MTLRPMPPGCRFSISIYITLRDPEHPCPFDETVVTLSGAKVYPDLADEEANDRRLTATIAQASAATGTSPSDWRAMTDEEISDYVRRDREGGSDLEGDEDEEPDDD